jgi:hypothetical protein
VNGIKTRISLLIAAAAFSSVFVVASPAAADSCHPMPEAYCNTITYLNDCVFWPPPAEYCDS